MSDLFDFEKPRPLFAVMGNPIDHSRSPEIHQMFARQFSKTIDYQRIHVDVGGFNQAVSNFQASGGQGLNVTVPFKIEAWQLADRCSDRAQLARAVNTIWFEDGLIIADNTDGVGMCRDIEDNLDCQIAGKELLILGAGGAVRGVLGELVDRSAARIILANRTVDKAVELARVYQGRGAPVLGCGFSDLQGQGFDIIINGTAASLSGTVPELPCLSFSDAALAYDMVYSTEPTVFMQWARRIGIAHISDGLGMLVEQAAESFHIWHGDRPNTRPVIDTLRSSD